MRFVNYFSVLEVMQLKFYVMIMNGVVISFTKKIVYFQITLGVTIN